MVENSPEGLVVLAGEVSVTVTREERHQSALARYAVPAGRQRHVVVELGWCTIDAGKHRGRQAIEVRLDGQRVGELTYLMSQRYAPLVSRIAGDGARPGCEAVVQRGARGLEVVLRLPRDTEGIVGTAAAAPVAAMAAQGGGLATKRRPLWIGGAVVGAILLIGAIANSGDSDEPTTPAVDQRTTTTTLAPPTTTTTTTTPPPPPPTTTTVAVVPAPVATQPVVPQTTEAPPPPPPPPAEPACDPNYTGCVPIADDVDCAGGSGNGPEYVAGPVQVIGTDVYDLDRDGDGTACEG